MNKTVIITGGTSAEAQIRAKQYTSNRVVFADSMPVPSPLIASGKFVQIPAIDAPHYIHELLKACLDNDASVLVLLQKEEIQLVTPQSLLFEEYNIEIVC